VTEIGTYGSLELEPRQPVVAGTIGTWTLTLTVGSLGIDEGGTIKMPWSLVSDWGPPQVTDPLAQNYTAVYTDGRARLEVEFGSKQYFRPRDNALVVHICDAPLAPGERVRVVYGDTSRGSPGIQAQTFAEARLVFGAAVDPHRTNRFTELEDPPWISIIAGSPARLVVVGPSQVAAGEQFALRVKAEDRFGNPCVGYEGGVRLVRDGGAFELRRSADVEGLFIADGLTLTSSGVHRFQVESEDGLTAESNPIICSERELRPYWGDLHAQSEETIGAGTVEDYFTYARHWAPVDFVSHQGIDWELSPTFWTHLKRVTDGFYEPGLFVTFIGYEWAGNHDVGGDHNVYLLDDDPPILRSSCERVPEAGAEGQFSPISELYQALRNLGRDNDGLPRAMVVPHVGGRRCNLAWHDAELEPLVEVCSWWGEFEWMFREALARDMVVGVVGGSDDHVSRPGDAAPGGAESPVHGGLTCVYSPSLTREGIWRALWARRCYATNGPRILLAFRTGDHWLGEVVRSDQPPSFDITVAGTAPIERIDGFRGQEHVWEFPSVTERSASVVRVSWRGAETKERHRVACWDGVVEVVEGTIESVEGYAFDSPLEGVQASSSHRVEWHSVTGGDVDGVLLDLEGADPTIVFTTERASFRVALSEIRGGPRVCPVGGLDLEVVFEMAPLGAGGTDVSATWTESDPADQRTSYWIRVLQEDGGKAWSSPIWIDPANPDGTSSRAPS
jgi:hypothetical protein